MNENHIMTDSQKKSISTNMKTQATSTFSYRKIDSAKRIQGDYGGSRKLFKNKATKMSPLLPIESKKKNSKHHPSINPIENQENLFGSLQKNSNFVGHS